MGYKIENNKLIVDSEREVLDLYTGRGIKDFEEVYKFSQDEDRLTVDMAIILKHISTGKLFKIEFVVDKANSLSGKCYDTVFSEVVKKERVVTEISYEIVE